MNIADLSKIIKNHWDGPGWERVWDKYHHRFGHYTLKQRNRLKKKLLAKYGPTYAFSRQLKRPSLFDSIPSRNTNTAYVTPFYFDTK